MKKHLLILILIFLAIVVFINPRGNFPLNDDWYYAMPVSKLVFENQLDFYSTTGPLLIAQVGYAFIFTKLTAFTFTFLRLSTLILAFIFLIAFYWVCYKLCGDKKISLLASLLILFNPIFLNTSFTFLTDIPFLCFYFLAMAFLIFGWRQQKSIYFILASLSGVISFFIRQNGIIFFVAWLAVILFYLLFKKFEFEKIKKSVWSLLAGVLICLVGYVIFQNNFNIVGTGVHLLEEPVLVHFLKWLFFAFGYLGIFGLPISILYLFNRKNYTLRNIVIFFLSLIIFLGITFGCSFLFPYNQNIINNYGLGPNIEVMQGVPDLIFNNGWQIVLSIFSAMGAVLLILYFKNILSFLRKQESRYLSQQFIFINLILQLFLILLFIGFDRYLLLLLPLVLILILPSLEIKKGYWLSVILVLVIAFFSVTLTKNYLDWNRNRNILYQQISTTQPYYKIDGGYELNGWYTYEVMQNFPYEVDLTRPWYLDRLFPKNTAHYVISFSELPNYRVLDTREYYNYFSFKNCKIYLLEKK